MYRLIERILAEIYTYAALGEPSFDLKLGISMLSSRGFCELQNLLAYGPIAFILI